ncbi:hypothetical protein HY409_02910 [Candidatus Gottesmanbacteria bacterium]|nr:hypothetical protein [Candidatus Gottesmanbacteria bacterium]
MSADNWVSRYLSEQGLGLDVHEIPLDPQSQLVQLLAADIAPSVENAPYLFDALLRQGDTEAIRRLHETGSGPTLLAETTNYLLQVELQTQGGSTGIGGSAEPLGVFQQLVTDDLLMRVSGKFYDLFVSGVIGQGEITDWDRNFDRIAETWYGPGAKLGSPIRGLRGLVVNGLLTLDEEEGMEEWLMKRCHLDEWHLNQIRKSRQQWHFGLEAAVDKITPGDQVDNVEFIKKQVQLCCEQGDTDTAIAWWEKLSPEEQVYPATQVAISLLAIGRQDDSFTFLSQLRDSLQQARLDSKDKSYLFAQAVFPHIQAADVEGVSEMLKAINPRGHHELLADLGISPTQLSQFFMLCHALRTDPYFGDLSHVEIRSLLMLDYRNELVTSNGEVYPAAGKMYASLLAARIFHIGESGINFPTAFNYKRALPVAKILSLWYGLSGDETNFALWLGRLQNIPVGGSHAVSYVYEQIHKKSE